MKSRFLVLALVLAMSCRVTGFAAEHPVLKGGIARKDITPAKPVTMSGYASRTGLSQGVHDPLSARAVALEQDGKRLVLVSTDLIGFYQAGPVIRSAILEACKLESSELFLSAIHTHSGPTPTLDGEKGQANNVEYTKWLQTQLIALVREAMGNMAPVQLGFGSGSSPVGCNRREPVPDAVNKPDKVKLGRNPDVTTDREVQVLKLSRADDDQLLAVMFAYATHSTAMGTKNYLIGGDVHGLAAQFIERYLGPGVIAPDFAGASGNIDPWFRVLPTYETANGWVPEPVLMGTMLGEEVVHVLKAIQKPIEGGPIRTAIKTCTLPAKARQAKEVVAEDPKPAELTISVARVGEVAFVGLGGEIFNEIGLAIKKASPFPHTVIISHCNGAAGYMPTTASYPDGGYEVNGSRFAPGADEQAIKEAVQMLQDLK